MEAQIGRAGTVKNRLKKQNRPKFFSIFTTTSPNQAPRIDSSNLIPKTSLKICLDSFIREGANSRVCIGTYQEKDVGVNS